MNIDKSGIKGQWRVWWIGEDGCTRERTFRSQAGAEEWKAWAEGMEGQTDEEWVKGK